MNIYAKRVKHYVTFLASIETFVLLFKINLYFLLCTLDVVFCCIDTFCGCSVLMFVHWNFPYWFMACFLAEISISIRHNFFRDFLMIIFINLIHNLPPYKRSRLQCHIVHNTLHTLTKNQYLHPQCPHIRKLLESKPQCPHCMLQTSPWPCENPRLPNRPRNETPKSG